MLSPDADRAAKDRRTLARRVRWERRGIGLFKLAVAVAAAVDVVAEVSGRNGWLWVVPTAAAVITLVELAERAWPRAKADPPKPLTAHQHDVLAAIMSTDGRLAAVKRLRDWTGATYFEATRDVDAAFPPADIGLPGAGTP